MAHALLSQIAYRDQNDQTTFIFDGSKATDAEKTKLDGDVCVQLNKTNHLKGSILWYAHDVRTVEMKNISLYQQSDLDQLAWLISQKVKIVFEKNSSYIYLHLLPALTRKLKELAAEEMKVMEGSTIFIPISNLPTYADQAKNAVEAARQLGFEALYCSSKA